MYVHAYVHNHIVHCYGDYVVTIMKLTLFFLHLRTRGQHEALTAAHLRQ